MQMTGRFGASYCSNIGHQTKSEWTLVAIIASPEPGAKDTPLPLLYLVVDFTSGRMALGWPWRCTTFPVGVLRCCGEVCIVRYRANLLAHWCIASSLEGSQSGLEASLGVIVGHFLSYLDLACLRPNMFQPWLSCDLRHTARCLRRL